MVNWVILGIVGLLIVLLISKNPSFFTPGPAPGPAGNPGPVGSPAGGPPPKYTQTKIINPGQDCNSNGDSGWTKIGSVTCAK